MANSMAQWVRHQTMSGIWKMSGIDQWRSSPRGPGSIPSVGARLNGLGTRLCQAFGKCQALINGGQAQEAQVQFPAWEPGSIG